MSSPAKPVQSTKKSASIVSPSLVTSDLMSPFSASFTSATVQLLCFTPRATAFLPQKLPEQHRVEVVAVPDVEGEILARPRRQVLLRELATK